MTALSGQKQRMQRKPVLRRYRRLLVANTNPKICDHCSAELPQTYRLEAIGYKAKQGERVMDSKLHCKSCGYYSARVLVFGSAK